MVPYTIGISKREDEVKEGIYFELSRAELRLFRITAAVDGLSVPKKLVELVRESIGKDWKRCEE